MKIENKIIIRILLTVSISKKKNKIGRYSVLFKAKKPIDNYVTPKIALGVTYVDNPKSVIDNITNEFVIQNPNYDVGVHDILFCDLPYWAQVWLRDLKVIHLSANTVEKLYTLAEEEKIKRLNN